MFIRMTTTDLLRLFFLSLMWLLKSDNSLVCHVFETVVRVST